METPFTIPRAEGCANRKRGLCFSTDNGLIPAARFAVVPNDTVAIDQVQAPTNALRVGVRRTICEGPFTGIRPFRVASCANKHHEPILVFPLHSIPSQEVKSGRNRL